MAAPAGRATPARALLPEPGGRIFRLFGGDKVTLLDFLRVPEDQPLESPQVARRLRDAGGHQHGQGTVLAGPPLPPPPQRTPSASRLLSTPSRCHGPWSLSAARLPPLGRPGAAHFTASGHQAGVERYYYELRKKLYDFGEVLAVQKTDLREARRAAARRRGADAREDRRVRRRDGPRHLWRQLAQSRRRRPTLFEQAAPVLPHAAARRGGALRRARGGGGGGGRAAAAAPRRARRSSRRGARGSGCEAGGTRLAVDTLWVQHMRALNYVKDFAGSRRTPTDRSRCTAPRARALRLDATAFEQNTAFSLMQYNQAAAQPADEASFV